MVRDVVYCSANDPSAVNLNADVPSAMVVSHSGICFIAGLMRQSPAYKYLKEGGTTQFDFVTWQEEHRHIDCYLTAANWLMVPALAATRYIIQIWDHTR